jgi:hypothetical protein
MKPAIGTAKRTNLKQGVSVLRLWRSVGGNCRDRNTAEEGVHQKNGRQKGPGFTYDVHLPTFQDFFHLGSAATFRDVNHA